MEQRPPKIGKNIQKLRMSRNLTLNVLSERSGVSKAMLSQIESDKVNPTVATVWKISKGLGVELQDVLDIDDQIKRTFVVNPVQADDGRLETKANGVNIRVLSPLNMVEDMEIYLVSFDPLSTLKSDPHYAGAQEFLTVTKGSLTVTAGENVARIKKGDFIIYHCDVQHEISNESNQPAEVHMVVRFQNEKR
ncbi:helix-turn-helix domain-containing protein [Parasphaerochaeta coccoides]|uniref:Helix-turn-helix domain protein n=1 Tax=Parasphaerochaeta coccoides (strain ATCC BAA-1237 / DSM 17374 / SPN1) TaxID=760011 RepID=F4GK91_PARC1|nr:XRE family transcriptional regulator [Parasphaerochaeta coccoides]AEC02287.1 helix-turn-helix domain protein [Parasphaerochaeta coccoides DSM 17374]